MKVVQIAGLVAALIAGTQIAAAQTNPLPPAAGAPPGSAPPPDQGGPPPGPGEAPPPQAGAAPPEVVNTTVNLRQGPGTTYTIVTKIPAGSPVEVSDCSGQWCQVTWQGQNGYIIATSLGEGGGPAGGPPPGGPPPGYAGPPPGYYPPPPGY